MELAESANQTVQKCAACLSISQAGGHKCIERSVDCDCPICGDYLYDSPKSVVFMQCGHSIHKSCFHEHIQTSYKCPLCSKSCVNMDAQFRNYDITILSQPMPSEYRDSRAIISCNDCSAKSQTTYHWLGLKCSLCASYNTIQHQLLNMPGQEPTPGCPTDRSASATSIPPPPASVEELGLPDLTQIRREMRRAARESERNDRAPSPSVFGRWFRSVSPAPGPASASTSASTLHPPDRTVPGQILGAAASTSQTPSSLTNTEDEAIRTTLPASSPSSQHMSDIPRGPLTGALDNESDDDDDDLEEDMLDFWGRSGDETRGGAVTSDAAGEADEEEESSSEGSSDEDGCEDEEDEEEDEIVLFGHR